MTSGKVFFKAVEGDFATQRDVSRRKRDIKTIVLKVRLDNPKGAYVPGMTAEVLVSPEQLKATAREREGARSSMANDRKVQSNAASARPRANGGLREAGVRSDGACGHRGRAHREEVRRLYRRR